MQPVAVLLYGNGGVGKTPLAVSAFWDWMRRKKLAEGRWITLGREDNPALAVPEEFRTMYDGKMSLRLRAPTLDDDRWVRDLDKVTLDLVKAARKGQKLDALVFDGFSEFDLLYEKVVDNNGGPDSLLPETERKENFAKWNSLLESFFSIVQRLDPTELGCDVICTARVMEKKRAKQSKKGTVIPGDPEYLDFDYYPAIRGAFRYLIPCYFNMVLYMDVEVRPVDVGGKILKAPTHILNTVATGDFFVKNHWEWQWMKLGLPFEMVNPMWSDVRRNIEQCQNWAPTE